jgi:hypothetical protein
MFALLAGTVAASEVCQNSMQEMNIGYDECMAIQTEFHAMVESGKSIDELKTDLAQCGGDDYQMDCSAKCGLDNDCTDSCMRIANNGVCKIDAPGCARQVAYGGYVKSHVLIQCYGMIDEGCKRLKTKYMPVQTTNNGAPNGVAAVSHDKWPSCKDLCSCDSGCGNNCSTGDHISLRGVDCGCGDDCSNWGHYCMKQNFSKYLHCVGRRVAKCYRQKWIVSKECINGTPTNFGGCKKEWDQEYHCEGSGCGSGCSSGSC